ncbi:MAG: ATP-binding protein, partial [Anaerolineales bacterium]
TGFQESSYWRKETERYRELAGIAKHVVIFAGQPLPPDSSVDALQITLRAGDPLRQEWFVAILSDVFSVVLVGLDQGIEADTESQRRFETLWSFDPVVVNRVLDILEDVVGQYYPQHLPLLRESRATYPTVPPHPTLLSRFTAEIIDFEDSLQQELRMTSEALAQRETLYRATVGNAAVALVAVDREGVIRFFEGQQAYALYAKPESLAERSVFDLPDDLRFLAYAYEQTLHSGNTVNKVRLAPQLIVEIHGSVMESIDGKPRGAILVVVDISERERIDTMRRESERLRLALEKEKELVRLKDRLMTTISHEFRTPLASIQSSSELLSNYFERMTDEQRLQRLANIAAQVGKLTEMLDDIALMVHSRAESVPLDVQQVDVSAHISRLLEQLPHGEQAHPLLFYPEGDFIDLWVEPRLLDHILTNLVMNAKKYAPPHTPIIIRLEREMDGVLLSVQDQGIGIPAEDQANIFEPFFRARNVGDVAGTGLGLTIVRDSALQHYGNVRIESTEGQGTTVHVWLSLLDNLLDGNGAKNDNR